MPLIAMNSHKTTHIATSFVHKGWLELIEGYQSQHASYHHAFQKEYTSNEQVDFTVIQKRYHDIVANHNKPYLPIEIAEQVSPLTFGSYSLALFTAPTTYTLLSLASEYSAILGIPLTLNFDSGHHDVIELNLEEHQISSRNTMLSTSGQFVYVLTLLSLVKYAAKGLDIDMEIHLNQLPDEVGSDLVELERRLGCTLILGATKSKLSFTRKGLFSRLPSSSPEMHSMALTLLHQQHSSSHQQNLVLRMCKVLDELSDLTFATADLVAQRLGMSKRTLNRRFADMNTNYRAVIEKYKLDKSIALLTDSKLSISIISQRLGFTDIAAYSRAFKRWTGYPPSVYRQA